jgi:hypothetical protein
MDGKGQLNGGVEQVLEPGVSETESLALIHANHLGNWTLW